MSLHDGGFMSRGVLLHATRLAEMVLTSGDPRGLKRKSHEKDKPGEEGSRLA